MTSICYSKEKIYASIMEQDAWSGLARATCSAVNAEAAALFLRQNNREMRFLGSHGVPTNDLQTAVAHIETMRSPRSTALLSEDKLIAYFSTVFGGKSPRLVTFDLDGLQGLLLICSNIDSDKFSYLFEHIVWYANFCLKIER